jgi:hypothetical protein
MGPLIYGEIVGASGLEELASLVGGVVRESCHYDNRRILRVDLTLASASFETAGTSVLVRGDGDALRPLMDLAEVVSANLALGKLRHRLELYEEDRLVGYYHFQWPQNARTEGAA